MCCWIRLAEVSSPGPCKSWVPGALCAVYRVFRTVPPYLPASIDILQLDESISSSTYLLQRRLTTTTTSDLGQLPWILTGGLAWSLGTFMKEKESNSDRRKWVKDEVAADQQNQDICSHPVWTQHIPLLAGRGWATGFTARHSYIRPYSI